MSLSSVMQACRKDTIVILLKSNHVVPTVDIPF